VNGLNAVVGLLFVFGLLCGVAAIWDRRYRTEWLWVGTLAFAIGLLAVVCVGCEVLR
jgi:hypothetical protein